MQSSLQREKIAEGVFFSHVTDTKFYSNRLSVHLITQLDTEMVTNNAVVPAILRLGCESCPDFTALNSRLGRMYGASLGYDVSRFGDKQVLSISVKGIDQRVTLQNEDMVAQLGELLCDIVLEPLIKDDGFLPENTALEKQNLIDTIESEINDKRIWAQSQCQTLLFGDSPRSIRPYGTVEQARAITPHSAYEAYKRLIRSAHIELMFVGSGDYHSAQAAFEKRFGSLERENTMAESTRPVFSDEPVKTKVETMDISQSKLVMGFKCRVSDERNRYALRLMTALYGGTPFSKLFLNVREKMSLCYYCAARYDRGNDVLMVSSGVEKDKKQQASEEILKQLEAVQKGDFSDEAFHNTILSLNTSFDAVGDSLYTLENWYLTRILDGEGRSPDEERSQFNSLTRDEVTAAASLVKLDAVYFLTSPDKSEDGKESK